MNYQELLDGIIKKHEFKGLSFTYGRALERAILDNLIDDEHLDSLTQTLEEAIEGSTRIQGLAGHFSLITLTHMADIALLDEVARYLMEDNS